jgi:hypothetical protein
MSIFNDAEAICGKCGHRQPVALVASVNADRRPDLRQAILDGSFQAHDCPDCGTPMRLPAHLAYIDLGRGQWILVQSADAMADWQGAEGEARDVFEQAFGTAASEAAREIGEGLTPRLVFGWPALREKLVCRELALDDTTLELLKIALMRDVPGPALADESELRLTGGENGSLNFSWVASATEQRLSSVEVPRDAYEDVADEAEDWQALRAVRGTAFRRRQAADQRVAERPARRRFPLSSWPCLTRPSTWRGRAAFRRKRRRRRRVDARLGGRA